MGFSSCGRQRAVRLLELGGLAECPPSPHTPKGTVPIHYVFPIQNENLFKRGFLEDTCYSNQMPLWTLQQRGQGLLASFIEYDFNALDYKALNLAGCFSWFAWLLQPSSPPAPLLWWRCHKAGMQKRLHVSIFRVLKARCIHDCIAQWWTEFQGFLINLSNLSSLHMVNRKLNTREG